MAHDDVTDESGLLAGLRRRDAESFALFFDAYVDRIYRLAMGILGNEADAEEVTQATFISAMQAVDRFEPHARLSAWLYRIAHNHAMMLIRHRRPVETLPEDDSLPMPATLVDWTTLPEERLLGAEARQELWSAIATLPANLRAAFILRDVEGLSTAECSFAQSITESACKVRLHRARLLLRERLSVYFTEWAAASESRAKRK
ncbi:MAG TPA: sigma-70 family RNA polymerase sigma factor [Ktedonobacterales bacterium]|jgi:RNA polymerase sigma-70 factor (ECF subfamily)|nr:sigma-70 family RNA polymerase sigma factor [Ktedonobacterales bacterium]